MQNTKRYASIDVVKGLAMIMVILVHYEQNFQVCRFFNFFRMGCPIFFVASGFGIMCLINKRYQGTITKANVFSFYSSRFMALAPGWYLAFLLVFVTNSIALLVFGHTLNFGSNREPISIICNLLFLNGLLPFCNNNVMPGGWYIGTTVILYLLTPLLLWGIRCIKNRKLLFIAASIICMMIWSALYVICPDVFSNGFGYYSFLVHLPDYLLGIMLYYDFSEDMLSSKQIIKCLPVGIIVFFCAIAMDYTTLPLKSIITAWMTSLSTYLLLYYMLTKEPNHKISFCGNILMKFGKNSYFIFLMHAFFAWTFISMLNMALQHFGVAIDNTILFLIFMPVVVILSYFAGTVFHIVVKKCTVLLTSKRLCQ